MLFDQWYSDAQASGEKLSDAMTLATADAKGQPLARSMLFKGRKERNFLFYTNYDSLKAKHLNSNPTACLLFLWKELYRQIRIQGSVLKQSAEESDAYWKTRPRMSQIGAWASKQSSRVESFDRVKERVEEFDKKFKDSKEIPRPDNWGGFALQAHYIEFWHGHEFRIHERQEFVWSEDSNWKSYFLFP